MGQGNNLRANGKFAPKLSGRNFPLRSDLMGQGNNLRANGKFAPKLSGRNFPLRSDLMGQGNNLRANGKFAPKGAVPPDSPYLYPQKAMKRKNLIFPALLLLFHSPALSQDEAGWPWYMQANAHLHAGFPIEGYADKQEKDGLGWGAQLLFQAKRGRPLFVGLEGSMLYLDKERLRFTAIENGQETDYRLVTNNNIFMAHGLLRFKPFVNSWVQPYADGLVGLKKLYTRTRLIDESLDDEEVVEAETDLSNTAFSYGLGAGLQVYLSDFPTVLGDIRVVYLPGENATYYTRSDEAPDPIEDTLDAFERVSSPTTLLLIQLGVTIQLSDSDFQEAAVPDDDF